MLYDNNTDVEAETVKEHLEAVASQRSDEDRNEYYQSTEDQGVQEFETAVVNDDRVQRRRVVALTLADGFEPEAWTDLMGLSTTYEVKGEGVYGYRKLDFEAGVLTVGATGP